MSDVGTKAKALALVAGGLAGVSSGPAGLAVAGRLGDGLLDGTSWEGGVVEKALTGMGVVGEAGQDIVLEVARQVLPSAAVDVYEGISSRIWAEEWSPSVEPVPGARVVLGVEDVDAVLAAAASGGVRESRVGQWLMSLRDVGAVVALAPGAREYALTRVVSGG